jgi:gas vesicle protein
MKLARYVFVGALGALAGLLLAPKPGRQLRGEVQHWVIPVLETLGWRKGAEDELSYTSSSSSGELQAKIEETRRRLQEQAREQG